MTDRCITLIDMDCFYVQVEQKINPHYNNKPCILANKGIKGACIAVSYEAREYGIKTGMRAEQAMKMCPGLHLFVVPEVRGKSDLTRYRQASSEILDVLCQFSDSVERASIDEAYIDLTDAVKQRIESGCNVITPDKLPQTFIAGYKIRDPEVVSSEKEELRAACVKEWLADISDPSDPDFLLLVGAMIVEEIRQAIKNQTGFKCSAGIAHNKILAKLVCAFNKPNRQTIIPHSLVPTVYATTPIRKVRNLGGKLGVELQEKLNIENMSELASFTRIQLQQYFGDKSGHWLYNIARGIDTDPVVPRQLPKSIGCGKNFPGKSLLSTKTQVQHWVQQLIEELVERLEKDLHDNKRIAKLLTVSIKHAGNLESGMLSKSCPIHTYDRSKIQHDAFQMIQHFKKDRPNSKDNSIWHPPIYNISISAGKFQDEMLPTYSIENFFSKGSKINKQTDLEGESKVVAVKDNTLAGSSKSGNEKEEESINDVKGFDSEREPKISCNEQPNTGNSSTEQVQSESKTNDTNQDSKPSTSSASFFKSYLNRKAVKTTKIEESSSSEALNQDGKTSNEDTSHLLRVLREDALFHDSESSQDVVLLDGLSEQRLGSDYSNPTSESESFKLNTMEFFKSKSNIHEDQTVPQVSTATTSEAVNEDGVAASTSEITTVCAICQKDVLVWEVQEHADFHFAQKLDKAVNQSVPVCSSTKPNSKQGVSKQPNGHKKRKKGEKGHSGDKKSKNATKTIDSYFGKK